MTPGEALRRIRDLEVQLQEQAAARQAAEAAAAEQSRLAEEAARAAAEAKAAAEKPDAQGCPAGHGQACGVDEACFSWEEEAPYGSEACCAVAGQARREVMCVSWRR